METNLRQGRQDLPHTRAGSLPRHPASQLRRSPAKRYGTILLPGRSEGLPRRVVLRSDCDFRGCDGSRTCQFSQAYVIAHEVGHHVQNLLGILPKAQNAQRAAGSRAEANRIQVRVELQADCLAGVWANNSNQRWNSIEPGDVEAAMQTAAAIGDDRLQQQSRGYVVPAAFTHGSSAQRQRWFMTGLKEGRVSACNTFTGQV